MLMTMKSKKILSTIRRTTEDLEGTVDMEDIMVEAQRTIAERTGDAVVIRITTVTEDSTARITEIMEMITEHLVKCKTKLILLLVSRIPVGLVTLYTIFRRTVLLKIKSIHLDFISRTVI